MPQADRKKLSPGARRLAQAMVVGAGAATLALPMFLITPKPAKITGFLAITLIFHNIITGSMGLPFYRLFPARWVRRYHIAAGLAGFALGIAHMIILLLSTSLGYYSMAWILGPVALALMALTIWVALDRRRLPRVWRRIHQINYAVFIILMVKVLLLGSDLLSKASLRWLMYAYAAVAGLGLAYRLRRYAADRRRKKSRMRDREG